LPTSPIEAIQRRKKMRSSGPGRTIYKMPQTWQSLRSPTATTAVPASISSPSALSAEPAFWARSLRVQCIFPHKAHRRDRVAQSAIHYCHLAQDAFVIMPNHVHGILLFNEPGATLSTVIGGFKSEVSRLVGRPMLQRY